VDAEQETLLREAMETVLARVDPHEATGELIAQGWAEARAEDEAFALGALFEAAGRALSPAPLLDLASPGTDGDGRRPALPLPGHTWAARVEHGQLVVDAVVLGGGVPNAFLVGYTAPETREGVVACVPAEELTCERRYGFDPQLEIHRLCGRVALETLAESGVTWSRLRALLRRCLAHELLGLATLLAERTDEHVRARSQFGRPLATWQTVSHRLADVHVEIAGAQATLEAAWWDERDLISAAAKCQAATAATVAATHAQQLFGAVGFTWEQELHRIVRRCYVIDACLGTRSELTAELGAQMLTEEDVEPCDVDL
jgi:hypothetical protein